MEPGVYEFLAKYSTYQQIWQYETRLYEVLIRAQKAINRRTAEWRPAVVPGRWASRCLAVAPVARTSWKASEL